MRADPPESGEDSEVTLHPLRVGVSSENSEVTLRASGLRESCGACIDMTARCRLIEVHAVDVPGKVLEPLRVTPHVAVPCLIEP